jgi:hypothetical protein
LFDPDARTLLTDALRPPLGFTFDQAIVATYSLDLTTLLSVPLNLTVFANAVSRELLRNQLALLEALKRNVSRLSIYCQQGRIHAPEQQHVLYGYLEPAVIEVRAPAGGAFHPKFWVLRYRDQSDSVLLRLIVLSRNLTSDRCWDVSLTLEGEPHGRNRAINRDLADLIRHLPELATGRVSDLARERAQMLGDEVHRAEWALPADFESLEFQVLGMRRKKWLPAASKKLAVFSPFCSAGVLKQLAATTEDASLLVCRPEELDRLPQDAHTAFKRVMTLSDAAEREDGEDLSAGSCLLRGLHAKVYITEEGWNTRVIVGSANASQSALLDGSNVELLAELVGRRSRIGGVDDLLKQGGLIDVLEDYRPPETVCENEELARAEGILEAAVKELCAAGLSLDCTGRGDAWKLSLAAKRSPALKGIDSIRAWLVTVGQDNAADADGLRDGDPVHLPECAQSSVTGFVAFELTVEHPLIAHRFVLNLPVTGLPAGRNAAVIRTIISNRDGFLRYLVFLLANATPDVVEGSGIASAEGGAPALRHIFKDDFPLLEELTRALSRDPQRLLEIRKLVDDLGASEEGRDIIPEQFIAVWQAFEPLCKELNVEVRD